MQFLRGTFSKEKSKQAHGLASYLRCSNKKDKCRKWKSLLEGSICKASNLKISEVFKMFFCFSLKLTVSGMELYSRLSHTIIVSWNDRIRKWIA